MSIAPATAPSLSEPPRNPSGRTPSIRRMIVGLTLAVIIAGTALLARVGCERMREVAPLGSADSFGRTVVGHGWSVDPIGFTVRYDDGTSSTQLWW